MIEARSITKRFGKTVAVDDITFCHEHGALALWGSNGAGKTTLIRCLLGILRARGSARICGIDVRRHGRHARALVGYVPQELAFHDDARLGRAIAFFASLRRISHEDAARALATVSLNGHEHKRVRDLSGGMKQRLALAIALLGDPPVIVLDEPTSNLDAHGRHEVVHTLRMLKQQGKTILFASHRPDEVIALADRVLVLEAGRLARDTTPDGLWPHERAIKLIRLHLVETPEPVAAGILVREGFAVHCNGNGLCVAVPRDRKASPISALARHEIEVRDLEVLEEIDTTETSP